MEYINLEEAHNIYIKYTNGTEDRYIIESEYLLDESEAILKDKTICYARIDGAVIKNN